MNVINSNVFDPAGLMSRIEAHVDEINFPDLNNMSNVGTFELVRAFKLSKSIEGLKLVDSPAVNARGRHLHMLHASDT